MFDPTIALHHGRVVKRTGDGILIALAALNPRGLDRMAEAAIAPYLDPTFARRAAEARDAWRREAQAAIDLSINRERFNTLSSVQQFPSTASTACCRIWCGPNSVEAIEGAQTVRGRLDAAD